MLVEKMKAIFYVFYFLIHCYTFYYSYKIDQNTKKQFDNNTKSRKHILRWNRNNHVQKKNPLVKIWRSEDGLKARVANFAYSMAEYFMNAPKVTIYGGRLLHTQSKKGKF